jgi:hypothetical protein
MNVVYMIGDIEHPDLTKIGYNSDWPTRYEQVRSHNPRDIVVHGVWVFDSKEEIRQVERKIHLELSQFHRKCTHGNEWFDINHEKVVEKVISAGIVKSRPLQDPSPKVRKRDLPYDDWRHPSDVYKNEIYKRLLWVFREESPQQRIKVIHSPLFDTCYKYAFTYNPFPVYLVAAYHHPFFPDSPSIELRAGNEQVEACWRRIVSDHANGPGLMATNVGWLNKNSTIGWVAEQAHAQGLVRYDLLQPKPRCVRPKDGQIPPTPLGGTWLKRVKQEN